MWCKEAKSVQQCSIKHKWHKRAKSAQLTDPWGATCQHQIQEHCSIWHSLVFWLHSVRRFTLTCKKKKIHFVIKRISSTITHTLPIQMYMKMTVLRDIEPCSLSEAYRRFRGAYPETSAHFHTTWRYIQNVVIFIVAAGTKKGFSTNKRTVLHQIRFRSYLFNCLRS
jgi:hypothetical protein